MNTDEDMALLSVQSLGSLQVRFGGRLVTLKMSKAGALLVYLMRHGDVAHGREQLATLLWPEESLDKTRENFRQALYQIRRIFGNREMADRYLTVTRETVRFRSESDHTLDANLFEQRVGEGAWASGLELYAGEFLATFYPADAQELGEWQLITREHLHQLAVHACTQLARQLEKRDPVRAADVARRLLALEPWAEEGHRLLMRWWAAQGQPAEALAQYQRCVTTLADELGIAPATETTALYEQIRDGRLAPLDPLTHNLPAQLTPLVGRQQELSTLQRLLADTDPDVDADINNRLITLVGPGGIGKTKLMVALGWATVHNPPPVPFTHIYFVSLAELEADGESHLPERITSHLLATLEIHPSPTASIRTVLAERWGDRPVLLLLDNWDHLTSASSLLSTWLMEMPNLHIVATSREPLGLYGETLFQIRGLDTDSSLAEPTEAGRLFVQSARRVQPRFQWDGQTAPLIRRICGAVDGHPLALEMAAAWLQGLTLAEVAEGVAEGLDLLTSPHADTPARQRDMRHILAQSWQKLTEDQQRMLAQLSLFRQPFGPNQAHAVAGASRLQLALVVAHFWLRRGDDGRYHFHELLRHFAREQLIAQPDMHQQARRAYIQEHLRYLQSRRVLLEENPSSDLIADLRLRHADLEMAWSWAAEKEVGEEWLDEIIATVGSLALFYTGGGLLSEGIRLLDQTVCQLRQLPATSTRQQALAHVLIEQAGLRNRQAKCELIPKTMAEAIELARALSDQTLLSRAYAEYGAALGIMGRLEEGRDLLRKGLALAEDVQNWEQAARIYLALGNIDFEEGLFVDGLNYYQQAIKWYEELNKPVLRNAIRQNLAISFAHLGQYDRARRLHQQNLASWRTMQRRPNLAMCLEGLGYVALAQNRLRLAELHLKAALGIYTEIEDLDGVAYAHLYLGHRAVAQGLLSDAATHYRAMLEARQKLGHRHLLNQGWAGLADVAWRRGEVHQAMEFVERCWPALLAGQVQGEEPMPVYLACYAVLSALGDDRATVVLEQAISLLNRQMEALGDDELARQTFMQAVPSHRALLAAAQKRGVQGIIQN
jgi:DNA-binding SARP family transcriptional activator/predicted ATPase/tetratricopeptide (TPR) repeat protein